jgi:hypothetical protein
LMDSRIAFSRLTRMSCSFLLEDMIGDWRKHTWSWQTFETLVANGRHRNASHNFSNSALYNRQQLERCPTCLSLTASWRSTRSRTQSCSESTRSSIHSWPQVMTIKDATDVSIFVVLP